MKNIIVSLVVALAFAATNAAAGAAMQRVEVRLPDAPSAVVGRIFAVFSRVVQERTGIAPTQGKDGKIVFALRADLGAEGYEIADGADGTIIITGNDERGLLFGVGAFLRSARFQPGSFAPGDWRGKRAPESPLRIAYLASHTGNWYENAPHEAVERYIEELGLWGYNAVMLCSATEQFTGLADPKAQVMTKHLKSILAAAKQIGLKTGLIHCANNAFKSMPPEFRATHCPQMTALGIHACPAIPAARQMLLRDWDELLEAYRSVGLDYACFWPYDNGGCDCAKCRPWGSNGYISISREMAAHFRAVNPQGEVILSSWRFVTNEWHELYDVLGKNSGWAQYLLANSCRGYNADVAKENEETVQRGSPGKLSLMVFPEISMAGMWPWGGRGATYRLADWKQEIAQARRLGATSIMPYSEGIYEDAAKVIWAQAFWDSKRSVDDILEEYLRYEYDPQVLPQILEVIKLLGTMQEVSLKSKKFTPLEAARGKQCGDFVEQIEPKLPAHVRASWRWKLFADRCRLESCLRQGRAFKADGSYSDEAKRGLDEISKIYCVDERTLHFTLPGILDRQAGNKQKQEVDDEGVGDKPSKRKGKAK